MCVRVCAEVDKEIKSSSMKKSRKTLSKLGEFIMKIDVESFGSNNLLQDFEFLKSLVKIAMNV